MQLGIIGLGKMGANMAKRLLAAGPAVVGFDLSELAPVPGFGFCEFAAAKLVYRLIGRIGAAHG